MNEWLIQATSETTEVAFLHQGLLQEYYCESYQPTLKTDYVGSIYLGKVIRVLAGFNTAFIDVGLENAGFLSQTTIGLFVGQTIVVQVLKNPIGDKGVRLTTHITLSGRNFVLLPQEKNTLTVSQKIKNITIKEQLKQRCINLLSTIKAVSTEYGVIVRTYAEQASDDNLKADYIALVQQWHTVLRQAISMSAPCLLLSELTLIERLFRDRYNSLMVDCVYINNINDIIINHNITPVIQHDVFNMYNIYAHLKMALLPRVDLKSGAYIVIEQTEALVSIDVNSGSFTGKQLLSDTILSINLEAAYEIARQLRLRHLSGIIVIDFIDMKVKSHQNQVKHALKAALNNDTVITTVFEFTALGLLEISRQRLYKPLSQMLSDANIHI